MCEKHWVFFFFQDLFEGPTDLESQNYKIFQSNTKRFSENIYLRVRMCRTTSERFYISCYITLK